MPLKFQDVAADHSDMLNGDCESCEYGAAAAAVFALFVSRESRDEVDADLIFPSLF